MAQAQIQVKFVGEDDNYLLEAVSEIKQYMPMKPDLLVAAGINTWLSRQRGLGGVAVYIDKLSTLEKAEIITLLREAEKEGVHTEWVGICGWEPRYQWLVLMVKRTSWGYLINAEWWGGAWSTTVSALLSSSEPVVWTSAEGDGVVALAFVRDVLRLLLGGNPCRDRFEIIGPTSAYCR